MLHEHAVFHHADLRGQAWMIGALGIPHHHHPLHGFAAREEFAAAHNLAGIIAILRLPPTPRLQPRTPLKTHGFIDDIRLIPLRWV